MPIYCCAGEKQLLAFVIYNVNRLGVLEVLLRSVPFVTFNLPYLVTQQIHIVIVLLPEENNQLTSNVVQIAFIPVFLNLNSHVSA